MTQAESVMVEEEVVKAWGNILTSGYLGQAIATRQRVEVYKAAIKFAAYVRGGMSPADCRRASVELILEADDVREE